MADKDVEDTSSAEDPNAASSSPVRRRRRIKPYPAVALDDTLVLAQGIVEHAGGTGKIRRLTLLEHLGRSADSSSTRDLITNSSKYGLTTGSYRSEWMELTAVGRRATDPDASPQDRAAGRFEAAIESVVPAKRLYDALVNQRLPSPDVLRDMLIEAEIEEDFAQEAAELFVVNAKSLGVLRLISGAERIIPIQQVYEELGVGTGDGALHQPDGPATRKTSLSADGIGPRNRDASLETTCFVVAPIGAAGSDERRHSDVVMAQIIEPAVAAVDAELRVLRADSIAEPGRITEQILTHIAGARLVVADLSFLNPNVFYELALRHAIGLPSVLVSREADPIPFDIADLRIVRMDMGDLYAFVPQIDAYRVELASHIRQALESPTSVRTPVSEVLAAAR